MSGHVYPGASAAAYPNSYAPDGKALRVVSCVTCEDTGRRCVRPAGIFCGCVAGDAAFLAAVDRILGEPPVTDSGSG